MSAVHDPPVLTSERINLSTELSPAECILRLQALINRAPDGYDKPWGGIGSSTIRGDLATDQFSLYEQTIRGGRTAELSATIHVVGEGSQITGTCNLNLGVMKLRRISVWVGLLLGGPSAFLLITELFLGHIRHPSDLATGASFGALFCLAAVLVLNGIAQLHYVSACEHARRLKRFLVYVLEVRGA